MYDNLIQLYKWFIQSPLGIFKYLTFIGLALLIISPYIYKHINLLFLYCIIAPVGSVLAYVCPKYFKLDDNIKIRGWLATTLDVTFHWIPFVITCFFYLDHYRKQSTQVNLSLALSLGIIMAYLITIDVQDVYDMCPNQTVYASLFGILLYIILTMYRL